MDRSPGTKSRWRRIAIEDSGWFNHERELTKAIEDANADDLQTILETAQNSNELSDVLLAKSVGFCCHHDFLAGSELLVQHYKANVELQTGRDKTSALMMCRSETMVHFLLGATSEPKAAANASNIIGVTPLMYAENKEVAKALIVGGAEVDKIDLGGRSALMHAILKDRDDVAKTLLEAGARVDIPDIQGRTVLMNAAWRNQIDIFDQLLTKGADPVATDDRGRTVLHHICQDRERALRTHTAGEGRVNERDELMVDRVLRTAVDVNGLEQERRTPLHLAATINNQHIVQKLTSKKTIIDINATDYQNRTPLHQAVANGHATIVRILLRDGARVMVTTDRGWTPLHVAAYRKNGTSEIVDQLMRRIKDASHEQNAANRVTEFINAMTKSHESALHLAAEAGNMKIVETLLHERSIMVNVKDFYGNTPMFNAARMGHKQIVRRLAGLTYAALTSAAVKASRGFLADLIDFVPSASRTEGYEHSRIRVHHLLTGEVDITPDFLAAAPEGAAQPSGFRWIHLPSNNVAWCQELLVRRFIERDDADPESFKALQMSFNHEHVGAQLHARHMRPVCRIVPRSAGVADPQRSQTPLSDDTRSGAQNTEAIDNSVPGNNRHLRLDVSRAARLSRSRGRSAGGHSSDTTQRPGLEPDSPLTNVVDQRGMSSHSMYLYMPYVHFEWSAALGRMREAIRKAYTTEQRRSPAAVVSPPVRRYNSVSANRPVRRTPTFEQDRMDADKKLVQAHIDATSSSIHIRRTLDQSFYRTVNTKFRDRDQVVTRYQHKHGRKDPRDQSPVDTKLLMVDQLWIFIVNSELMISCFPRRWEQPSRESDDVLSSLLSHITAPSHGPIANIYELAMAVTGHCVGMIDSRHHNHGETLFLDMFEEAIGHITNEETKLFRTFEVASDEASQWLRNCRTMPGIPSQEAIVNETSPPREAEEDVVGALQRQGPPPPFIHTLLDVQGETQLLREIKDIQDELGMLHVVLKQQEQVCLEAYQQMAPALQRGTENVSQQYRFKQAYEKQNRRINNPLKDIERMQAQAEKIYIAIKDLLDLKQKYANAMQAADTARQGQTLLVFTVVTVVFLPLSFLAAFFAIQVDGFPRDSKGDMSLSYVSRYVFGVGFALALPCVVVALTVKKMALYLKEYWKRFAIFISRSYHKVQHHIITFWQTLTAKDESTQTSSQTPIHLGNLRATDSQA